MTLVPERYADSDSGAPARERIDDYLASTGLDTKDAKVVPLTGDASDRRYFRVLLRDEPAQVLAVHPGAIDFESLPFVNVAHLLLRMPVPVPKILGHSDELGIIARQQRTGIEHRDPRAKAAMRLRHLNSDWAATDDDQVLR